MKKMMMKITAGQQRSRLLWQLNGEFTTDERKKSCEIEREKIESREIDRS
jgi:hypothetical protein